MTYARFDRLNDSLQASGLDAVILNPGPTLTHLTGLHFHLMERPVVLLFAQGQAPAIVLPELELQKVASLPYPLQVFPYPENPAEWDSAFRKAVQALGLDGKQIGVEPRDVVTLAASCALVVTVALLAAYLPARRAPRVDPIGALRAD